MKKHQNVLLIKQQLKEIREMANEFIQWLRTAEESSDEEERR